MLIIVIIIYASVYFLLKVDNLWVSKTELRELLNIAFSWMFMLSLRMRIELSIDETSDVYVILRLAHARNLHKTLINRNVIN